MLSFKLELARSYARSHPNLLEYKLRYDLQSKMSWHSDLKVLPTTCFRLNTEGISPKFPIPKTKLNRINMSFPVQVL